jgi:hypothetical protein
MSTKAWNTLKGRVMAVHGPNIDCWGVRIAVNKYLFARQIPDDSGVDAFNTVYEVTHLPYRKKQPGRESHRQGLWMGENNQGRSSTFLPRMTWTYGLQRKGRPSNLKTND